MPYADLHDFLQNLENQGQLLRVKSKVNPDLEIAEIMRRMVYAKNQPAVLFEEVEGYDIPIAGNIFSTSQRMHMALETTDFTEIGMRITDLTRMKMPSGLFNKLKMLPKLSEIGEYGPKYVETGPVTEQIQFNDANLNSIPVIKSYKEDAAKFITFGLVVTQHPDSEIFNMGVYRIQILSEKKAAIHWQIHKRGAQHLEIIKERKEKIPVAIVIGCDPATIFSAVSPVPEGLDKYLYAGIIRKKGIKITKCKTNDLHVPANAEIVLEGFVDPEEIVMEGPFGDHTGYYTPKEPFPTFTLSGIMSRKNPIYLTTVVGKPILEDAYIGKAIEKAFLPLIQMFHPEVIDYNMPSAGWFQGLSIFSIKKRYPGQARKVMMGLWGRGQLSLTKMFVVVDDDINVHDMDEVIWAITTRTDPKRDIMIIENTPTDTLDPASPLVNLGSKLGIDATTKMKEEGYFREIQKLAEVDDLTKELVTKRWNEYGLPKINS